MSKTLMKDMPHLRKKMNKIDKNRVARLREARDTKDFKTLIEHWVEEKTEDKFLNQKQKMAVFLLTDFVQNYTYDYVAKYVGVSTAELAKWRNTPVFMRELDKEINKRISFVRLHAFRNINRSIVRGNVKDSWKYLEMTGDFKRTVKFEDNTGEKNLTDEQLELEIKKQSKKLLTPSAN